MVKDSVLRAKDGTTVCNAGIVSYIRHVTCSYLCMSVLHEHTHVCFKVLKAFFRFIQDFIIYIYTPCKKFSYTVYIYIYWIYIYIYTSFPHSQYSCCTSGCVNGVVSGLRGARPHQESVLEHHQKVTLMKIWISWEFFFTMLNSFFIGSRCLGSTYLGCNLIRYYNGILQLHVNNFGWMSTLDLGLNYFQVNVLLKHGIFWTPNMSWWWWNLSFSTEVRNLWQERPFEECMHLEEDHTRIGTRLVETHWERFLESKKLSNQRGASWKLRLGQLANLSSWPLPPKKQKHTHTHSYWVCLWQFWSHKSQVFWYFSEFWHVGRSVQVLLFLAFSFVVWPHHDFEIFLKVDVT